MAYTKDQLINALYAAADRYGVDRDVAYRQINQESRFNPNAVSHAGAQGIAQFMPGTARDYGLSNPFDPIASFDAWGRYMRDLLRMFSGDYAKALAGYNWGQGRVRQAVKQWGNDWLSHAPSETRNYVAIILPAGGGSSSDLPDSSYPDIAFDEDILSPSGDSPTSPDGSNSSITPVLLISAAAIVAVVLLTD